MKKAGKGFDQDNPEELTDPAELAKEEEEENNSSKLLTFIRIIHIINFRGMI